MIRIFVVLLLLACTDTHEHASTKSGGASSISAVWFKSPEEIKETIIKTFCIDLGENEVEGRDRIGDYIHNLGVMYGSVDMGNMRTPLQEPTGTYLLALDIVSMWLSKEIIQKQYLVRVQHAGSETYLFEDSACAENPKDTADNRYLFNGTRYTWHAIADAAACRRCYEDASKVWCDCQDNVYIGQFSKGMEISASQRKRLMHNIQDIGDFLGVPVDNELVASDNRHVPRMLLEDVFIPALVSSDSCNIYELLDISYGREGRFMQDSSGEVGDGAYGEIVEEQPPPSCTDFVAWQQVVYALLMSGPFYMQLETVER